MADRPSPSSPAPPPRRNPSLSARLFGTGARGARTLAGATGIDRAVETATEEAIVRALESPAVERAFVRVLQGPAVEEAVDGALRSEAVERAVIQALDSDLIDRVWERLLQSDEAQKLVERIAEAPEVRSAVAAQGVGLIEDVGRQIGRVARRLDDVIEGFLRRIRRRPRREERTGRAGLVTRGLALALDGVILNALFAAFSALVALALTELFGGGQGVSTPALLVGTGAWLSGAALYLVSFWSLAGQTPGMRFLGIHLDAKGERRIGARRARRRLLGSFLAALPLGLGFAGILGERRRGLHDRIAGTQVLYAESRAAGS